jgi:hypothetical protein
MFFVCVIADMSFVHAIAQMSFAYKSAAHMSVGQISFAHNYYSYVCCPYVCDPYLSCPISLAHMPAGQMFLPICILLSFYYPYVFLPKGFRPKCAEPK